jgi:hypothetical protein
MIEGVEFDISSQELAKHLHTRVEHHNKRAKWYADKADTLAEGEFNEETRQKMSSTNNANPVDTFKAGAKRHKAKASLFSFMATHVIQNETYRLSENDLNRLELTESEYLNEQRNRTRRSRRPE